MPSPKDTNGPVTKTGPTRGQNRSRNKDGEWRKKRSDTGKSRDKKKSGGCFITTAACAHRGLPDDCAELQTLQRFRDEELITTPDGQALVSSYYEIAPAIAANLKREADFEFVWECLQRCIRHIDNADREAAVREYQTMVVSLSARV